jgi:hypothetical protein
MGPPPIFSERFSEINEQEIFNLCILIVNILKNAFLTCVSLKVGQNGPAEKCGLAKVKSDTFCRRSRLLIKFQVK